uniref:Uncharacterized protein n=1 Tax=Nelumbo nucifera TaxID=4432 RepID=A0A822YWK3_NELNU|nr:TPA_asm: hypothetical protein HUJ06_007184 [Nelumbo nucifera]
MLNNISFAEPMQTIHELEMDAGLMGLIRCFWEPRKLPWLIHGFHCHAGWDLLTCLPSEARAPTARCWRETEARIRKKRTMLVIKDLTCPIVPWRFSFALQGPLVVSCVGILGWVWLIYKAK